MIPTESKVHRLPLWALCLIAFVAMFIEDVLGTVMVVLEANFHPYEAGLFDVLGTYAQLASNGVALVSIIQSGWRSKRSLCVIASVSLADFFGTTTGVEVARAFVHH